MRSARGPWVELASGADASALDTALSGASAVVVSAPAPARAALVTMALERGVPCVAPMPLDEDAALDADLARRASGPKARLVPLFTAFAEPGVARVIELVARGAVGIVSRVTVSMGGGGGGLESLTHAIALGLAVSGTARGEGARMESASRASGVLRATLRASGAEIDVAVESARGAQDARVEVTGSTMRVRFERDGNSATLELSRAGESRSSAAPVGGGAGDLAVLAAGGADVPAWLGARATVRAVALAREVHARTGDLARTDVIRPPGAADAAAWRACSERARAAGPGRAALVAAGLEPDVEVPDDSPALREDPPTSGGGLLEALAFDEGLKPALYLTVERARAREVLERYRGCAVESLDYACTIDALTDVRDRAGAEEGRGTHVDLFVARDPAAARRAREIYSTPRGPTARLEEMGEMLGYPRCCVAAFAALPDRSNNTATRYAAHARTAALGAPFVSELNNLFAHVVPFFPCSYACPRAATHAGEVLAAFARSDALAASALRAALARPVFYVDNARQVYLEGARADASGVVRYTAVCAGGSQAGPDAREPAARWGAALASVMARGDGVRARETSVEILAGNRVVATLGRRAPGLGAVFPFGL